MAVEPNPHHLVADPDEQQLTRYTQEASTGHYRQLGERLDVVFRGVREFAGEILAHEARLLLHELLTW